MTPSVHLRDVQLDDLEVFFTQQADPEACSVASFEARGREAFFIHWKERVLKNPTGLVRAIVSDGQLAGNIVCWGPPEERLVGYWLGREFWGQGIATLALKAFLPLLTPPVFAHVARSNPRSIRVVEKAGFVLHEELDELIFRYTGLRGAR